MDAKTYLDYKRRRREIIQTYHAGLLLFVIGILAGTMLGITITLQVMM